MATITHVSTPASGAVAIYELLTLLLAAGWRVTRWSDATTYTDETASPLAFNPYGKAGSSGAAASIVAGAAAGEMRVQGLTGMASADVGRYLTISGADSAGNNGRFEITAVNSATEVDVVNASAVMPDANNGSISWVVRGLGTTSAWFTVRASDSSREWLFQRNASDAQWTINRSKAGFITGGTATVLPTATDTAGSALFTAATAFSATPGRLFISADDAASYGWRLMVMVTGGGNVRTLIMDEPLTSTDPSDTDPYLWIGYYSGGGLSVYEAQDQMTEGFTGQLYKRFTTAGSNQRVGFLHYRLGGSNIVAAPPSGNTSGALPSNLREVVLPIVVTRLGTPSTSTGWCGYAAGIRWSSVQGRANGQTLDGNPAYWIYAGGMWLPWDSSAPALS
jgi:hypothetical protein